MNWQSRSRALLIFGLIVIASGCFRFFTQEGGSTGLTFGLVMGSLSLIAGWIIARGHKLAGLAIGILTLVVVGGWFAYEALVLKGWSAAEPRQLIVLTASIIVAGTLAFSQVQTRA